MRLSPAGPGQAGKGLPVRHQRSSLNLTDHLDAVIADLCARLPEFAHVQPRRLLCCLTRARQHGAGGVFAKIVPMRFPDGTPFRQLHGVRYALPQIPTDDGDVLYLIYVYVPRFFTLPFEHRLLVLVHELFHIAPAFDGTIRRFGSRAHGASRDAYNARLQPLVDRYLQAGPPDERLAVLRGDFHALAREHHLVGRALTIPKAVRIG